MRAARKLFAKREFDEVTVGEIAKAAGVAEGTVYLYFESKADLLRAVLVAFYDRLTEEAADGVRRIRDTRARLAFLAEHHVRNVIAEHRILFGAARLHGRGGRDDQYRLNRAYVAVFDDVIRNGLDRGEIRSDVPLWLLRDIFYGSLEYAARTSMLHEPERGIDEVVGGLMRVLEDGAGPVAAITGERDPEPVARVLARLERVAGRIEAAVGGEDA